MPETVSIYHGYGGKLEYSIDYGKISRQKFGTDDISTLLTFYFPGQRKPRQDIRVHVRIQRLSFPGHTRLI
jgi:hypothetical protein